MADRAIPDLAASFDEPSNLANDDDDPEPWVFSAGGSSDQRSQQHTSSVPVISDDQIERIRRRARPISVPTGKLLGEKPQAKKNDLASILEDEATSAPPISARNATSASADTTSADNDDTVDALRSISEIQSFVASKEMEEQPDFGSSDGLDELTADFEDVASNAAQDDEDDARHAAMQAIRTLNF